MRVQKKIEKINQTNTCFFEKKSEIRQTKQGKRERTQINKVINIKGDITMDTTKVQSIIIGY